MTANTTEPLPEEILAQLETAVSDEPETDETPICLGKNCGCVNPPTPITVTSFEEIFGYCVNPPTPIEEADFPYGPPPSSSHGAMTRRRISQ